MLCTLFCRKHKHGALFSQVRCGCLLLWLCSLHFPVRLLALQDADDEYWAATSPDLAAVSGKYFVNKKARESPSISYDEDAQLKLWECLERQTGMQYRVPLWRPGAH